MGGGRRQLVGAAFLPLSIPLISCLHNLRQPARRVAWLIDQLEHRFHCRRQIFLTLLPVLSQRRLQRRFYFLKVPRIGMADSPGRIIYPCGGLGFGLCLFKYFWIDLPKTVESPRYGGSLGQRLSISHGISGIFGIRIGAMSSEKEYPLVAPSARV